MSYLNRLSRLVSDFLDKTAAKPKIKYTKFDDGIVINADCCEPETFEFVKKYLDGRKIAAIVTDPPYFINVKSLEGSVETWDRADSDQQTLANWMKSWTKMWLDLVYNGGAVWIFGGIGIPKCRPFPLFATQIENELDLIIVNWITWGKRRGFGTKRNLLFCREEILYCLKGNKNEPRVFNIPLLSTIRPYSGWSVKYPALSKFYRRSNVWTDINELFRSKVHSSEKPVKLISVPIGISTKKSDIVLDCFGGGGSTALAARELGRKFILIERDPKHYKTIITRLKNIKTDD